MSDAMNAIAIQRQAAQATRELIQVMRFAQPQTWTLAMCRERWPGIPDATILAIAAERVGYAGHAGRNVIFTLEEVVALDAEIQGRIRAQRLAPSHRAAMRVAVLAVLATCLCAADLVVEPLMGLASYHWNDNGQNQCNPGFGLSLGLGRDAWQPFASALVYDDSHNEIATAALVGLRRDLTTWIGLEVGAGYLHSTTYEGPALLPSIYAGTDPLRVSVTALGTRALGFSLRWRLP